jgi:phosphoserine phosphatase
MAKRKARVAIIYDFDGTLSPGNMQEYDFFPQLKISPSKFWETTRKRAQEHEADEILAYMTLMLDKAAGSGVQIDREAFARYGKEVELFPGVIEWFEHINQYAKDYDVVPEHYILSSGIREMVAGTPIAKHFKKIFASSFIYEQHGVAKAPGLAINYTTKTQFLFRINKGALEVWDNAKVNAYQPKEERNIPFEQMIYIGDGTTDIPCMKLTKDQGGHSIAVYRPGSPKKATAEKLLKENRVNFVAPADYTVDKTLDKQVKAIIYKIAADFEVHKLERSCKPKDK